MEIKKLHPDIHVEGLACPMWVPLVENFELDGAGTDYFVKKSLEELMEKDHNIDTIILGCTHYPLLLPLIQKHLSSKIKVIAQGEYIASSLQEYLHRHPEMADKCTRDGTCRYLTTENNIIFDHSACRFMQHDVQSQHIELTY
jgi:glutamate racemase